MVVKDQMTIGKKAIAKRVFSQTDFDRFASLSGDDNPIHVDANFSANTRFGRTVCHGMLLYTTISQVLSDMLPGSDMVQLEQSLMFPTPTFAGEEMTVRSEVMVVQPDGDTNPFKTVTIDTTIAHPDGQIACQGQTTVGFVKYAWAEENDSEPKSKPPEVAAFKGLRLGQVATTRRIFTEDDLVEYSDLTGDNNPFILDGDYARQMGLKGPMIPGGLLGGLFSYLLGTKLPGRGTNWLKQHLRFHAPAYPGDEILARVQISRLRPDKDLVNLETRCSKSTGKSLCTGEALVLVTDLQ